MTLDGRNRMCGRLVIVDFMTLVVGAIVVSFLKFAIDKELRPPPETPYPTAEYHDA